MTAAGDVSDYDAPKQAELVASFATALDVPVDDVSLMVSAASVNLQFIVAVDDTAAAIAISDRAQASLGTAADASSALGVSIQSVPVTITSASPSAPPVMPMPHVQPPSTPPPQINLLTDQDSSQTTGGSDVTMPILGAAVVAGAFLIVYSLLCIRIQKSRKGRLALQMSATGQPTSSTAVRPRTDLAHVNVVVDSTRSDEQTIAAMATQTSGEATGKEKRAEVYLRPKTAAAKDEPAATKVTTAETQEVTVTLRKPSANASTGLTIIAGETKDAPPLIKDVEGIALESGVRAGDSIVAINDKPAGDRITAAALIRAEPQMVVLRLKRPNPLAAPGSITTVAATFKMTGPLGISFKCPNPDPNSRVIEEIAEGGLAHTEGSLQVGDLVVSVNDLPVANFAHMRISDMLKGASEARIVAHRSGPLVAAAEEATQAETPSLGQLSDEEVQRQELASRDWLLGQNTAAPEPVDQLPEELEVKAGVAATAEVNADRSAAKAPAVVEEAAGSAGVGTGPVSSATADRLQRARLAAAARHAKQHESQDAAATSAREGVAQWLAEAETPGGEEGDEEVSEVLRT